MQHHYFYCDCAIWHCNDYDSHIYDIVNCEFIDSSYACHNNNNSNIVNDNEMLVIIDHACNHDVNNDEYQHH